MLVEEHFFLLVQMLSFYPRIVVEPIEQIGITFSMVLPLNGSRCGLSRVHHKKNFAMTSMATRTITHYFVYYNFILQNSQNHNPTEYENSVSNSVSKLRICKFVRKNKEEISIFVPLLLFIRDASFFIHKRNKHVFFSRVFRNK